MGKLICFELEKLFQRWLTWLVIGLLLFVNCAVLLGEINDEDRGYTYADVAQVYADLGQMDDPQGELEGRFQWLLQHYLIQQSDLTGYPYAPYKRSLLQEQRLITYVYDQLSAGTDYDAYLDYVEEQAARLSQGSLFSTPDSFSQRNGEKISQVYHALRGRTVTLSFSDGVRLVTDWRITDGLILLAVVCLILNLLISERETGMLALIKSTKRGRRSTLAGKLITLAILTALLTLVFYGANLLLAWHFVGLGDLDRTIQSLYGYLSSIAPITVGQYLLAFFPAKFLGLWTVGNLVFALCLLLRSTVYTLLATGGVLGLEFLLWQTIDSNSWLCPLSQCNLMYLLDTGTLFATYSNMDLLGWPVNTTLVVGVLALAVDLGCVLGSLVRFHRENTVEIQRLPCFSGKRHGKDARLHTNLFAHEAYKLLVTHKGLLLLGVLLVLQWGCYGTKTLYTTQEEYYYRAYAETLSGPIGQRQVDVLQQQAEEFALEDLELEELGRQYAAGEVSQTVYQSAVDTLSRSQAKRSAFQRAWDQMQKLLTYSDEEVCFLDQTGWERLLGEQGQWYDVVDAAKLAFVLILACSGVFSSEYLWGTDALLRSTRRGTRAVTGRKLLLCGGYALIAALITYLPRFFWVASNLGIPSSGATAHSVLLLSRLPGGLPLSVWVVGLFLCRCIGGVISVFLILYLSHKTKHTITCILISAAVLLIPVFLCLLGLCGEIGLLPLLTGHAI